MRSITRTLLAATVMVVALGLVGCANDDAADESTPDVPAETVEPTPDVTIETGDDAGDGATEVTIETFIFAPDPVEVDVGTTVTFRNLDDTIHTVTAGTREEPGDQFDAELSQDETFEPTFDEPGTYDYFCAIHSGEGMTGQVAVR